MQNLKVLSAHDWESRFKLQPYDTNLLFFEFSNCCFKLKYNFKLLLHKCRKLTLFSY